MVRGRLQFGVPIVAEHVVRQETVPVVRHIEDFRRTEHHRTHRGRRKSQRSVQPAEKEIPHPIAARQDGSERLFTQRDIFVSSLSVLAYRPQFGAVREEILQRPPGNAGLYQGPEAVRVLEPARGAIQHDQRLDDIAKGRHQVHGSG